MIVSTRIAKMFKHSGFVNIDYLMRNKLETNPSKILNILNRDWRKWVKPRCMFDGGDPNFGYELPGVAWASSKNVVVGAKFTCPLAGTGVSMTMETKWEFMAGTIHMMPYADVAGYPGSLLGYTNEELTTSGTGYWHTIIFTPGQEPTFVAATPYWLCWNGKTVVAFDHIIVGDVNQYTAEESVYQHPPIDPYPAGGTQANNKFGIYCTYTSVAPPPPPKGTVPIHAKLVGII